MTLREEVQPEHITSEHHAAQLIERVGWAVGDAKNAEGKVEKKPQPEPTASEDELAIVEPWVVVDTTGV